MRSVLLLVVLVACGDDDGPSGEPGTLDALCYPNGTCNATLQCVSGVCRGLLDGGTAGDAPGSDGNATCADDSALEPNDTIQQAWVTPVDTTLSFNLASLAICPAGDVDVYSIQITTPNRNIELLVNYASGAPLQASLLNSGGVALANASTTPTPGQLRAYTPNLPVGLYYARVQASASDTNDYSMTINVTGP